MLKGLLILLICVICASTDVKALDSSEILALNEILQNYPDLAHVPRYYGSSSVLYEYGPEWTGEYSNCAAGTSSWAYHGIHCENGNVDAIQLYA